jgi:carbamoyltransferase
VAVPEQPGAAVGADAFGGADTEGCGMVVTRRLFQYDPVIGFRYIPNLKARCPSDLGGYLLRTNEAGFRCEHPFEAGRKAGKRRALLFGDSFTAGNQVANGDRYGDQLEQLIPGLEVFNFGLPGTGTDQQFLAWRECVGSIEHDILIVAVLVENIRRNPLPAFYFQRGEDALVPKPYFVSEGSELVLKNVPVPRELVKTGDAGAQTGNVAEPRFATLRRLICRMGLREVANRFVGHQPVPEYGSAEHPSWLLLKRILERWIAGSKAPVVVMPIPLHHFVDGNANPSAYRMRFRELQEGSLCVLHDPLEDLRRYPYSERRRFRFPVDVHPTPSGHRALAESLAPVVRRVLRGDYG